MIFSVSREILVGVDNTVAFDYVSDLTRSGEWSPECLGGSWLDATGPRVGAVFLGHNHRAEDVVAWAPVVRGDWTTQAEVIEFAPPARFAWAMRDSSGRPQDSVWSFGVELVGTGSRLTHGFRMGRLTEGMRGILAGMSEQQCEAFVRDWSAKIDQDLRATLRRIKERLEPAAAGGQP